MEDVLEQIQYLLHNKEKEQSDIKYQNTRLMELKFHLIKHELSPAERLLRNYTSEFPSQSSINNSVYQLLLEVSLLLEQGKFAEALDTGKKLLASAANSGKKSEIWATQAMMAYCYVSTGEAEHAVEISSRAYQDMANHEFNSDASFLIQLYHYLVLKKANKLEEAYLVLEEAYSKLILTAKELDNEEWSADFLKHVPEHATLFEEWSSYHEKLEAGTVLVTAAEAHAPKRGQLIHSNKKKIYLSLYHPADETEGSPKTLRLKQIIRFTKEAEIQQTVLAVETNAKLLKVSRITVIRDIQELEARGIPVKTRGRLQ